MDSGKETQPEVEVNGYGASAQDQGAGDCKMDNELLSSGIQKESNGNGNASFYVGTADTDDSDTDNPADEISDIINNSNFEDECFDPILPPMTDEPAEDNRRQIELERELIRDALERDRTRQVELQAAGGVVSSDPFLNTDFGFDPLGVLQHPPQWEQAKLEEDELFQGSGLGVELAQVADKVSNLQLQDFKDMNNARTIEKSVVDALVQQEQDMQEIQPDEREGVGKSGPKGQEDEYPESKDLFTKSCDENKSEHKQSRETGTVDAENLDANIQTKPDVDLVGQNSQPRRAHVEGVGVRGPHNINKSNVKSNAAGVGVKADAGKQQRVSPKIPNGNTQSKPKSAAVVEKKAVGAAGLVNKTRSTSEPVAKDVRSTKPTPAPATKASRRSDAVAGIGPGTPGSTVSTARPQTSSHRVPVTGPSKPSDSNVKSRLAPKAKPDQNTSTSTPRASKDSKDLFEISPLTAGLPPELTKLAKTTPSHLIHPSSSVCRPATSLVLSPKPKTPAKGTVTAPSPAKPAKLTPTLTPSSVEKSRKTNSPSVQPVKMGDADGSGEKVSKLKDQFTVFSRFGDISSDGKQITLSNCDKWMKQAHVIDGKKITTTDTSILFKKLFKTAKKIGFEDFKKYVEELATSKKLEPKDILEKLANCGTPGTSSATKAAHTGVVERLTDTSKYTGSHKERFDSAGKGRGIEGRRNVQDDSGYVAAFKDKKEEEKRKSEGATASPTPAK